MKNALMKKRRLWDPWKCRFGRWYLAGKKEKDNVIMWQSRSVQSGERGGTRGEAGREALALPQERHGYTDIIAAATTSSWRRTVSGLQ